MDNDVDLLKERTSPPVPPVVLSARDSNGLTALHKAAGLANTRVVEYLLSVWPESATEKDATGKTPLHYAASAKNNDRCFNLLVQAGADEETQDNVSELVAQVVIVNLYCFPFLSSFIAQNKRIPNFYKTKAGQNEMDRSVLTVVPDAPRIPQIAATEFDWNVINPDQV